MTADFSRGTGARRSGTASRKQRVSGGIFTVTNRGLRQRGRARRLRTETARGA